MKDNETLEFENRTYINPDVSRDEQMAFIDTMRDIQAQNNAQIATETHNLGTDIESTRGGLSGSEEYWKSLYQTPQTEAAVANMKAVAQQSALNDALSNYQSMLQNRYNQAYRDYNKRVYEHNRSRERQADSYYKNSSGGSSNGSGSNTNTWNGEIEKETPTTTTFYGVPRTTVTEEDGYYVYTDTETGQKHRVSKEMMDKIYDENGNLTDEGAVILDTRRLLGL